MSSLIPNGIGRRHDAILENSRERPLRRGTLTEGEELVIRYVPGVGRPEQSERVYDRDARKERGAEGVDTHLLRREGLCDRAINPLAKDSQYFRHTQIRPQRLRIGERSDLTAGS